MFLLAVGLWMQVQSAQPVTQSRQVSVQVAITPEPVTVGQHFTVTLTVHAPAALASSIQFLEGPDTAKNQSGVTVFAPTQRHDVVRGGYVDATATYSLAAWTPGKIVMALDDVVVAQAHVKLPHDSILVSSVLPKDSTARAKATPKLPRPLLPEPPLYQRLLRDHPRSFLSTIILAALALAVLIAWLLWRRSRRIEAAGPLSAWVEHEFQRVEAMHLVERGEMELHAILMTKVVRDYLIRKFSSVHASATTRELVSALRHEPLIPTDQTLALFERIDLLKFAQDHIQKSDAQAVGVESRAIVHEVIDREEVARAASALEVERNTAASGKTPRKSGKKPPGRRAA